MKPMKILCLIYKQKRKLLKKLIELCLLFAQVGCRDKVSWENNKLNNYLQ